MIYIPLLYVCCHWIVPYIIILTFFKFLGAVIADPTHNAIMTIKLRNNNDYIIREIAGTEGHSQRFHWSKFEFRGGAHVLAAPAQKRIQEIGGFQPAAIYKCWGISVACRVDLFRAAACTECYILQTGLPFFSRADQLKKREDNMMQCAVLILISCLTVSQALPGGAPLAACSDLTPRGLHEPDGLQEGRSGFTIDLSDFPLSVNNDTGMSFYYYTPGGTYTSEFLMTNEVN